MFGMKLRKRKLEYLLNQISHLEGRMQILSNRIDQLESSQEIHAIEVCTTYGTKMCYQTSGGLHEEDAKKAYDVFVPGSGLKKFEPVRLAVAISLILDHLKLVYLPSCRQPSSLSQKGGPEKGPA
jgi:hypothetical protein